MFWNRFPFARILLPFLTGITVAVYFGFTRPVPLFFLIFLCCLYAALVIVIQKKLPYRLRWISGVVLIIFFLLAGYQLSVLKDSANQTDYFGKYTSREGAFLCTLLEPVQEKEKTYKAIVEINSTKDSAAWRETSGNAIIYFEKDSNSQQLTYGDNILVFGSLHKVGPSMNPGEFNYKAYLKNRSIEYSAFITKGAWKLISSDKGNPVLNYAYTLRQKLLSILEQSGMAGKEYGVISALLIGYTDKLDPDLIKDYQGSGAVHILSVSGMHVGVIYLVLNFFLFFFDRFRYGRIPKAVILILFVWCYAILTGLSPAVMRAATMFTCIALGRAAKYPPNIFNTLAASAFILLVFDPGFLFDIGFQLSYLAVAGIFVIYPFIYRSWGSKYKLVNHAWSLITVSIATQIVTFPLSMFYFHQFPNYFILTNIVAVPLSAVIIYLGIVYLICYSVPWLSLIISKALTYSLLALNNSISFIESLPYSVSRAISITGSEMVLLYLVIAMLCVFLMFKKPRMLTTAMVLFLLFMGSVSFHSYHSARQKKIIVYNISRHTAIDFVNGNDCYFVTDSSLQSDTKKQEFHINSSRILHRSHWVEPVLLHEDSVNVAGNIFYKNQGFMCFAEKRIAIVDQETDNDSQIAVDILLLSNNPKISINRLLKQYKPGLIVMDASNYTRNVDRWIFQCDQRHIPYYATSRSGALVYEF